MTLIAKPFITICGDNTWCEEIEKYCIPNLPMEPTEWIRKSGSGFKLVHVDIDAKRFKSCNLMEFGNTILDSPLFHLFVIVENEDLYNKIDKEEFSKWIGALRVRSIENWKLFVIPDDGQKNKFTFNRFSINSKMKLDFNIQKIENHLIKIIENPKERFVQIQSILRDIILNIYDDKCFWNEDKIRIQRETRFTPQWNYFDYFSLQEELADIYECLSLYEESLAQFDETNFIFVKCLDGFYKGEKATWINQLKDVPFDMIGSLILTNYSDPQKRHDLSKGKLCLADFRAYLLSRQCALLQLLNKYQEIPSLVYSVLIDFLNECKLLSLNIDSSIKNSWIFLTSLQALQRFSPIDCENTVAQDYAALFLLALNSINKLADDWNIWVKQSIDWTPIETLVKKLSVLNHDEYGDTPSSRLASGLKNQKSFQEFHVKLYEEALVILKHIGRMRSANLLGVQLADLYYKIGNYEEAEPFYLKAIKCLINENWINLALPLKLKLAQCQKDQFDRDPEKYMKTCLHLVGAKFFDNGNYFNSNLSLNYLEQEMYFNELKVCVNKSFSKSQTPCVFKLEPLFSIKNVKLLHPIEGYQMIELIMISNLPQSIESKLCISGIKFHEIDFTKSVNNSFENIDTDNYNDNLNEVPAQHSIPLTDRTSPQIHKDNKSNLKFKKEVFCRSSLDEAIPSMDAGVKVQMHSLNKNINNDDDKVLNLICFPKVDAGLRARKVSISRDTCLTSSIHDAFLNSKDNEEATTFNPFDELIILKPGENNVILRSKKFGLFLPRNIEVIIFNEKFHLNDIINEIKIDANFHDVKRLDLFMPNFLLEDQETVAFVNFNNSIKLKLKMGYLSFLNKDMNVEIFVKNENYKEILDSQKIDSNKIESSIMMHGSSFSLCGPLHFNLDSDNAKIYLRVPGLFKRELQISSFEDILILEKIIPSSSNKYIVKIELQKPLRSTKSHINYVIKSSSLKLHHSLDLCQLLPSVHKSLSTGIFNDRMNFTLLWCIENIDIFNYEKEIFKFTLSLDLMVFVNDYTTINGSICHEFELNHY